jgi:hypothetical protein
MNDGLDMQSRVSGIFPNIRLLVSARNPKIQQQSQQQEDQSNSDLEKHRLLATDVWITAYKTKLLYMD